MTKWELSEVSAWDVVYRERVAKAKAYKAAKAAQCPVHGSTCPGPVDGYVDFRDYAPCKETK